MACHLEENGLEEAVHFDGNSYNATLSLTEGGVVASVIRKGKVTKGNKPDTELLLEGKSLSAEQKECIIHWHDCHSKAAEVGMR